MAEGLVAWDQARDLGELPNSRWLCPGPNLFDLGQVVLKGKRLTDDVVIQLNGARYNTVHMTEYAGGFMAATIVDAETGDVLTEPRHTKRLDDSGVTGRVVPMFDTGLTTKEFLINRPIPLEGGAVLSSVVNHQDQRGTETTIQSAQSPWGDPPGMRSFARINPVGKTFDVKVDGIVSSLPNGRSVIQLGERPNPNGDGQTVSGSLSLEIWDSNSNLLAGRCNVTLNDEGQAVELVLLREGLLDVLGLEPNAVRWNREFANLANPQHEQIALNALAKIFGHKKWQGVDMRATAIKLNAALGEPDYDMAKLLVMKSAPPRKQRRMFPYLAHQSKWGG